MLAGLSVSGFGVGCYRMGVAHKETLVKALQGAINVVDTSTTYLSGRYSSSIVE
jgi:aryl-alcohol dehydrogenase-like predicted oxidoreductase